MGAAGAQTSIDCGTPKGFLASPQAVGWADPSSLVAMGVEKAQLHSEDACIVGPRPGFKSLPAGPEGALAIRSPSSFDE